MFHDDLEKIRRSFLPDHHPDNPVVLHRNEIVRCTGSFACLTDQTRRDDFDAAVLELLGQLPLRIIATVIDKSAMKTVLQENDKRDPYGMSYRPILAKYGEFLEQCGATGNVTIESRGRKADKVLAEVHTIALEKGIQDRTGQFFKNVLSPASLLLRAKSDNISGIQLADLLCYPMKAWLLEQIGVHGPHGRFHGLLMDKMKPCLSSHQMDGFSEYCYVLYPRRMQPSAISDHAAMPTA